VREARGVARPRGASLVLWLGFGGLLLGILAGAIGTLAALDHAANRRPHRAGERTRPGRAEDSIERSASSLRHTLLLTFGATLAGGLLLTLLTIGHTVRLERELERRLAENSRAAGAGAGKRAADAGVRATRRSGPIALGDARSASAWPR